MIDSIHVLRTLQERGYTPDPDPDCGESWFDLTGPRGRIRAVLKDDGDAEIIVHGRGQAVTAWGIGFSGAPGAVFLAALDAAEQDRGISRRAKAARR